MKNKKTWTMALLFTGIFVLTIIVFTILIAGFERDDITKVGFVMTGNAGEDGWNRLHYEGITKVCDELEVELIVRENIKENTGQCEAVIRELAQEEADMIILSSYGYGEEVLDVVDEYSDIAFYSESFDYTAANMKSYFARMYQARYLAGIVAGMYTQNDCIGYVAAMPNNEVNRGINAFTLGVRRVNPNARVVVAWSDSWDDVSKEKELARRLIEECQADVITYHQNQPNVVDVAEEYGIASIGYHEPVEGVSDNFLTSAVFNWDLTYKEVLLDYIRGKSDAVDRYWVGIEQGAVGLSEYSPKVSQEIAMEVDRATDEMKNGYEVFSGEIFDREGITRCKSGENISDDNLLKNMDWYVEGVEFYEK